MTSKTDLDILDFRIPSEEPPLKLRFLGGYPEDILKVQHAVITVGCRECSLWDAKTLWERYSQSLCAGWMMLDEETPESIWAKVEDYIDDTL